MSVVTREKEQLAPKTAKPSRKGPFARQPISTFWKLALGGSIFRSLGGLGGIAALTASQGAPSRDIVATAIVSITIVLLLLTRLRWATLVTTVLSGYLLLLTFTQPFALEDLANPKGSDGFVLFITAVLAFAFSILVFGSNLGAAIQTYLPVNKQTPTWLPAALTLIVGMIIGATFIGAMSTPPGPVGLTYTNGVPTVHMSASGFLVSSVTISKGQKLLVINDSNLEHDLTNGNWVNSDPIIVQEPGAPALPDIKLQASSVSIGPFTTAGTFHFICTIHRGMTLTVTVQ